MRNDNNDNTKATTPTTTQCRKGGEKLDGRAPSTGNDDFLHEGFNSIGSRWSDNRAEFGREERTSRRGFLEGSRGNNESRSFCGTVCYRNWKDGTAHKEQKREKKRERFFLSFSRARARTRQGAVVWRGKTKTYDDLIVAGSAEKSFLSRHIRQWVSIPYPPLFPLLPPLFF